MTNWIAKWTPNGRNPRASPGRKRGHRETTWPGEEEEAAQFVARLEQQQAAAEEEPLDVEAMLGPEA